MTEEILDETQEEEEEFDPDDPDDEEMFPTSPYVIERLGFDPKDTDWDAEDE